MATLNFYTEISMEVEDTGGVLRKESFGSAPSDDNIKNSISVECYLVEGYQDTTACTAWNVTHFICLYRHLNSFKVRDQGNLQMKPRPRGMIE